MDNTAYQIRQAKTAEFHTIGQLLVEVYSRLEGFPTRSEQPQYYNMLEEVGNFTQKPNTEFLVAISPQGTIDGAVVFFADMQQYGSGGTATMEKNSAGFRLLAVHPQARGLGIGKLLTLHCIEKAKELKLKQVIIHTTKSMATAWKMYENIGFKRSEDLDFMQGQLPVYGFKLKLF